MKKLFLVGLMFFATPAFAGGYHHVTKNYYSSTTNVTNIIEENSRNKYGAMLDAPNLIRLNRNWTIGAEGGKDFNGNSGDEGYFVYGKVTYSGTLLNLTKGE